MNSNFQPKAPLREIDPRYAEAQRRVRKIKGFYVHFFVYLLVNGAMMLTVYNQHASGTDFWSVGNLLMPICWGVGLAGHGFSVFGDRIFFGTRWEERKIRQLMEKDKRTQTWQ